MAGRLPHWLGHSLDPDRPVESVEEVGKSAARRVQMRGERTGNEHAILQDRGSKKYLGQYEGEPGQAAIPSEHLQQASNARIVHNHPGGGPLSPEDIHVLKRQGVKYIHAIGSGKGAGDYSVAGLRNGVTIEQVQARLKQVFDEKWAAAAPGTKNTAVQRDALRQLKAEGLINYREAKGTTAMASSNPLTRYAEANGQAGAVTRMRELTASGNAPGLVRSQAQQTAAKANRAKEAAAGRAAEKRAALERATGKGGAITAKDHAAAKSLIDRHGSHEVAKARLSTLRHEYPAAKQPGWIDRQMRAIDEHKAAGGAPGAPSPASAPKQAVAGAGAKPNTKGINKHAAAIESVRQMPMRSDREAHNMREAHGQVMKALERDKTMKAADKVAVARKLGDSTVRNAGQAIRRMSQQGDHMAYSRIRQLGSTIASEASHGGGKGGLGWAAAGIGVGLLAMMSGANAADTKSTRTMSDLVSGKEPAAAERADEAAASAGMGMTPRTGFTHMAAMVGGVGVAKALGTKEGIGGIAKQVVTGKFGQAAQSFKAGSVLKGIKPPTPGAIMAGLKGAGMLSKLSAGYGALALGAAAYGAYQGYQAEGLKGALKGGLRYFDPTTYLGASNPVSEQIVNTVADYFGGAKAGSGNPGTGIEQPGPEPSRGEAAYMDAAARFKAQRQTVGQHNAYVMAAGHEPEAPQDPTGFRAADARFKAMRQASGQPPPGQGQPSQAKGAKGSGKHHVWTEENRENARKARQANRAAA